MSEGGKCLVTPLYLLLLILVLSWCVSEIWQSDVISHSGTLPTEQPASGYVWHVVALSHLSILLIIQPESGESGLAAAQCIPYSWLHALMYMRIWLVQVQPSSFSCFCQQVLPTDPSWLPLVLLLRAGCSQYEYYRHRLRYCPSYLLGSPSTETDTVRPQTRDLHYCTRRQPSRTMISGSADSVLSTATLLSSPWNSSQVPSWKLKSWIFAVCLPSLLIKANNTRLQLLKCSVLQQLQEAACDTSTAGRKETCLGLNLVVQFLFQELKDTQKVRRYMFLLLTVEYCVLIQLAGSRCSQL